VHGRTFISRPEVYSPEQEAARGGYDLVSDNVSVWVDPDATVPTQAAENVSLILPEIVVAVAVAVLVPVNEHACGPPNATNAPSGAVIVNITCEPEIVPAMVPAIGITLPAGTTVTGPVTFVEFCAATHVTEALTATPAPFK
jgi:hypothetical protein